MAASFVYTYTTLPYLPRVALPSKLCMPICTSHLDMSIVSWIIPTSTGNRDHQRPLFSFDLYCRFAFVSWLVASIINLSFFSVMIVNSIRDGMKGINRFNRFYRRTFEFYFWVRYSSSSSLRVKINIRYTEMWRLIWKRASCNAFLIRVIDSLGTVYLGRSVESRKKENFRSIPLSTYTTRSYRDRWRGFTCVAQVENVSLCVGALRALGADVGSVNPSELAAGSTLWPVLALLFALSRYKQRAKQLQDMPR